MSAKSCNCRYEEVRRAAEQEYFKTYPLACQEPIDVIPD